MLGRIIIAGRYFPELKRMLLNKYSYLEDEAKKYYGYDTSDDFVFHHLITIYPHVIPTTLSGNEKEQRCRILIKVLKYMNMSELEKRKYEANNDMSEIDEWMPLFLEEIPNVCFIPREFHDYLHKNKYVVLTRFELQKVYRMFNTSKHILEKCDRIDGTVKGKCKAIELMLNFFVTLDNKDGYWANSIISKLYKTCRNKLEK